MDGDLQEKLCIQDTAQKPVTPIVAASLEGWIDARIAPVHRLDGARQNPAGAPVGTPPTLSNKEPPMENCESLRKDARLAGKLLDLARDFRLQAAESGVPQELRNSLNETANVLCEAAIYTLKKG